MNNPENYAKLLGNRILEVAKMVGGQKNLADLSGLQDTQIHRYIKGANVPGAKIISDIALSSNINGHWLLTGEGPMRPGEQETTTPSQGRGIEGYPEIGAVDVLDGIEIIEKIILKRGGKLYSPEQKVEMVRLACEIFADEDRKTSGHGNVVALNRIERAIRMAG